MLENGLLRTDCLTELWKFPLLVYCRKKWWVTKHLPSHHLANSHLLHLQKTDQQIYENNKKQQTQHQKQQNSKQKTTQQITQQKKAHKTQISINSLNNKTQPETQPTVSGCHFLKQLSKIKKQAIQN